MVITLFRRLPYHPHTPILAANLGFGVHEGSFWPGDRPGSASKPMFPTIRALIFMIGI